MKMKKQKKGQVLKGLMQISTQLNKAKEKKIDESIKKIQFLEKELQKGFDANKYTELGVARQSLRSALMSNYKKQMTSTKASYYSSFNKRSRLMAMRSKPLKIKTSIPLLYRSKNLTIKVTHSQEIANMFKAFYEKLYNLEASEETYVPNQNYNR